MQTYKVLAQYKDYFSRYKVSELLIQQPFPQDHPIFIKGIHVLVYCNTCDKDKMMIRPFHFHNGNPYSGETASWAPGLFKYITIQPHYTTSPVSSLF